jgi:hypothetical protein
MEQKITYWCPTKHSLFLYETKPRILTIWENGRCTALIEPIKLLFPKQENSS